MFRESFASTLRLLEACLVLEDDSIIRLDIEDTLRQFGMKDIRSAASLTAASSLVFDADIRFAILDYEIGKTNSISIAETLLARGVPMMFLTAYGKDVQLPAALSHIPVLAKPFTTEMLAAAVLAAVKDDDVSIRENLSPED
jgi:CheY-like chemotaxis protein